MAAKLSVNLNAIAMLRNRRDLPWPDVVGFGRIALEAGAAGVTIHPRPDERHIRFSDVPALKALVKNEFPGREYNIEGYPSEDFLELVERHLPDQVTLVPDDPAQATSDHGWDFAANRERLSEVCARLKRSGMRVSLFADGDCSEDDVTIAREVGADRIELYTGPYGGCYDDAGAAARWVEKLGTTADRAMARGLDINAGHDLTIANLPALATRIPKLAEVSIGHGLTADALQYGMAETVKRYRRALGDSV
ncbi:pyridoxine 5'-phosphate synthase [Rhizobium sp. KVB221]|uniref:Pyridoxine 5'-phosphate synthase n=1 Tax=Rhizobium setariae TaxID=2801340 RepID=A0A937CMJ2_9HYPH|nr:pyridoxine 5'-phosphate synthase [Rhizobium setariae]MBL0374390.1 pyridoxine 5'-phosphate synthase [Rhizobium setariae]